MGFSRQEYWHGLPFPSPGDHILPDLSTMTCPSWVAPQAWLSFIELDKAVVLVWLDWLVFCDYGFSVSSLWCPLATSTVLLGFLLLWTWDISSQLLQQSAATAPYFGWGVSPHHFTSWPGEFLFQYPIILPFHTVHGVLKASGPHCVKPLHHDLPILGGPTRHGLISLS